MDKTSKIASIILVVIILVIVVWYGVGKKSVPEVEKPIRIGAILALTGDLGFVGEGMRNALEMAKDNALIEYGKKVEFVIQDDKSCSPTENITIMNQFANVYKLRSVIGSTCSHSMLAITPVADNNKVLLISPSATIPEIRDEGEYIFRTCPADDLRAKVLAEYIYDKIGKRVALLYENADAPIAFNEMFKEIYENLGGEIVAEEINERGATDLRTQIS
ncbi:MAG: ABC transporter substrate-binding protein, partial [Candidatus Omnitrophota bacterium]